MTTKLNYPDISKLEHQDWMQPNRPQEAGNSQELEITEAKIAPHHCDEEKLM